jgi:uncharacterized protein
MYAAENGRVRAEAGWEKLPWFWFLLFLSYRCTKRCSYCYSFRQVGRDNESEMDDRTFARLLEWIPEVWRASQVKVSAVGFLGGEPLLRPDRIRRVMDSVYTSTDGMQGFLYTNGDLVDELSWEDLEDIQWISMNATDTPLDELSRRMALVGERANVIGQTVVATLDDHNLERALELTRFGLESGYRLRYHHDLYRGLDEEYRRRLLRRYHEICDLLEEYAGRGFEVHTTFLVDTLIPLWDHEASPYPCGKRLATVFPDGAVGPCIRSHTTRSGSIFDPDPMKVIQCETFHYGFEKLGMPEECRTCESRAACQGGCPNDKLVLTGSTSGKSVMCEIHQEILPRLRELEESKAVKRSCL